jgi:hypothetical protein
MRMGITESMVQQVSASLTTSWASRRQVILDKYNRSSENECRIFHKCTVRNTGLLKMYLNNVDISDIVTTERDMAAVWFDYRFLCRLNAQ